MHHQQCEDTKSRNRLDPGKNDLPVHNIGEVPEKNSTADADHSHQTEDRRGKNRGVTDVDCMGDLVRHNHLIAHARQCSGHK